MALSDAIAPIWADLQAGRNHDALDQARQALQEKRLFPAEERAALLIGLAAAELRTGGTDSAKRLAGRSLDLYPRQWSAHRILLTVLGAKQAYQAAYLHLSNLPSPGPVPAWDEPLTHVDRHVALAAWAWQLGHWESVAEHLTTAYPEGISAMPSALQEDWFKLALYRGRPEDAAAVAALLIADSPEESTDALLQTIVQNGWTKEALPLYRVAFAKAPRSQLLRRRLVALCIREGALEEARQLTKPGALGLAA